jgi:uncharacterized protein (DUF1330 family)
VTVYAIAQLSIHNRDSYDRYAARFMPILLAHGGKLLAAEESPQTIEGQYERDKVVLMEFPDKDSFRAWAGSPEYQEISKDRRAGADTVTVLIRGLPQR